LTAVPRCFGVAGYPVVVATWWLVWHGLGLVVGVEYFGFGWFSFDQPANTLAKKQLHERRGIFFLNRHR